MGKPGRKWTENLLAQDTDKWRVVLDAMMYLP
jgi:hypothetical protein